MFTHRAVKKLLVAITLALVLLMAMPVTSAFADDDVPVSCELSLQVIDPGTDVVIYRWVINSGQVASGTLDCGVIGILDHPLDGVFTTFHGSIIEFDKSTGGFSGRLKGSFTLEPFTSDEVHHGELRARVNGVLIVAAGSPVLNVLGNVITIGETVSGKWTIGSNVEGPGKFSLDLSPILLPITTLEVEAGVFLINPPGGDPRLALAVEVPGGYVIVTPPTASVSSYRQVLCFLFKH